MNYTYDWRTLPEKIRDKLADATVFYTGEWSSYNKHRNEKMLYLWDDSFILAIRVKKVLFLKAGLLDGEPFCYGENDNFEKQQRFLDECCQVIKKKRLIDWMQTEISANFMAYPSSAVVFGSGNYALTLENCTDEELMQKMHSKNRNMIRRGEREGITISRTGDKLLPDYKSLEDQVWERQGRSLRSLEYFGTIVKCMPNTSSVAVAYNQEGEPEAGVLFLYTKAMGYYHHGASRTNHTIGAHNYLLFEQFRYLRDLGVKKICFVGYRRPTEMGRNAKSDSIQKFKEKFSDEELQTFGFKVVFNKLHYMAYRLANMVINKDPYKDLYDNRARNYPEYNQR